MCKKLLVLCLMLGLVSYTYAINQGEVFDDVQISSWEGNGNADGWEWIPWNSNTIVSWSTTAGVTDGSYSLAVDANYPGTQGNNWWYMPVLNYKFIGADARAAFFGNDTFSVDVATLMAEWVNNSTAGWNFGTDLDLIINCGDNSSNSMWTTIGPHGWDPTAADYSGTLSWNYQAQKNVMYGWNTLVNDDTEGWVEILLLARTPTFESAPDGDGHPGNYYLDNAWLTGVPEPTTIALLGLGSLALLRRKR
jgi:hypothetical protein